MTCKYEVTIKGVMSDQHIAALAALCHRQLDPATGMRLTEADQALLVLEQLLTQAAEELCAVARVAFHAGTQDPRPWNSDGDVLDQAGDSGLDLGRALRSGGNQSSVN